MRKCAERECQKGGKWRHFGRGHTLEGDSREGAQHLMNVNR